MAGRGLFLLGTGLTFAGEYGKAQEKLASEQPGLSESERNGKAAERNASRSPDLDLREGELPLSWVLV